MSTIELANALNIFSEAIFENAKEFLKISKADAIPFTNRVCLLEVDSEEQEKEVTRVLEKLFENAKDPNSCTLKYIYDVSHRNGYWNVLDSYKLKELCFRFIDAMIDILQLNLLNVEKLKSTRHFKFFDERIVLAIMEHRGTRKMFEAFCNEQNVQQIALENSVKPFLRDERGNIEDDSYNELILLLQNWFTAFTEESDEIDGRALEQMDDVRVLQNIAEEDTKLNPLIRYWCIYQTDAKILYLFSDTGCETIINSNSKDPDNNPVILSRLRTVAIQKIPWQHKEIKFAFYKMFLNLQSTAMSEDGSTDDDEDVEKGFRKYLQTFFD